MLTYMQSRWSLVSYLLVLACSHFTAQNAQAQADPVKYPYVFSASLDGTNYTSFKSGSAACEATFTLAKQAAAKSCAQATKGDTCLELIKAWSAPACGELNGAVQTGPGSVTFYAKQRFKYGDGSFSLPFDAEIGSSGTLWAACPRGRDLGSGQCIEDNIDDQSCKAGNPVSPGSGEKFHDETDYQGAGAHPLEFSRSYRSFFAGLPKIAHGWTHNWQISIETLPIASTAGASAKARRADGTHTAFKFNGTAWQAQTNGSFDTLTEVKTGNLRTGWQLKIWANDSTEHYSADGALLKIVLRNGWTTTITYSTAATPQAIAPYIDLPITITNHFGRKLELRYNAMGQLIKLIDPAGGEIKYGYDSSANLNKVTWQDGASRQYLYASPATGRLTGVIDEMGVRIGTYAYDNQGRVVSTEKANGADKLTLLYNVDKSTSITDYTPSPTGVGAPTATTRTHRFAIAQGVVRPASVTAPCPVCGNTAASITYDASGNVTQRTEHDGTVTKLAYDSKNRETSRIAAFGTAAAKTYTTQWHATWNLPTLRAEPLKITAYTYDAKGNLTGQADTPTTDVNGSKGAVGVRDLAKPLLADGWVFDANNLTLTFISKSTTSGASSTVIKDYRYAYDQFGNEVTTRNALNSKSRTVVFNSDGLPISGSLNTGILFSYQYNVNGFLIKEKWGSDVIKINWNNSGRFNRIDHPNGSYTLYQYDSSGRYLTELDYIGYGVPTVLLKLFDVMLGTAYALPQDKWYGRTDPGFKDYVHGIKQSWGHGGAYNFNQQEIESLYKDWKDEACKKPEGKGRKSGKGGSTRGGGRNAFFRGGAKGLE
jgi:YD repeat-containing protein